MKTVISIDEAGQQLARLVDEARRGEEVILTDASEPVARLVPVIAEENGNLPHPRFGSAKGLIVQMAPDFDAPLDDFREYME